MFTGNRGVIHDPDSRTLLGRRWTTKAWIICDCGFQGRRRVVFGRNASGGGPGWTNLFFLDEVTALAAGHRPCFECRREKAREFADCFGHAAGLARPRAVEIDRRLHGERLAAGGASATLAADAFAALPEGAVCFDGTRFLARAHDGFLIWSFHGYQALLPDALPERLRLVSPRTTLDVLAAGYRPVWHRSAASMASSGVVGPG